jgi:hypothetical protein
VRRRWLRRLVRAVRRGVCLFRRGHKALFICVECAADADCLNGWLCDPWFKCYEPLYCDSDKDCKDYDMVCDKEAGLCVECLANEDCADDHFCKDAFCLPDVCVGGSIGCDGNAVAECLEDGSGWFAPVPCAGNQYCEAGECHEKVCEPDTEICAGSVRKVCDSLGKGFLLEEDCAEDELVCVKGLCLDLECPPAEDFCVNDGTLGHCADDGLSFEEEPCAGETYCSAGACVPWVCKPGEPVCNGFFATACNEFGSGAEPGGTDCAEQELCCSKGACAEPLDELCDGKDNDCNGQTDEGCDDDGDGWCDGDMLVIGLPASCPLGAGDCDDEVETVHPGQKDIPGDGLDNDCDGKTDEVESCPGTCTGQTVEAYLCALELCLLPPVISAKFESPSGDNIATAWAAVNHFGAPTNDLAPWAGNSYGLLATGTATGTSHTLDLPGGGAVPDPFSKDGYSTYDNVEFQLVIKAPNNVLGFSIDYIFMSVEYEEYVGTSFNDKFYIFLTAPTTTEGQKTVINQTACSNPNAYYDVIDPMTGEKLCYMAINTAFSEPCSSPTTDISGTGFECGPPDSAHGSSTGWLTTSWPIAPGEEFSLIFHIHDASDGIFDSEVILDNFQWLYAPFTPGTTKKVQ